MSGTVHTLKVHDPKYDTTLKILFGSSGAEKRTISFLNAVLKIQGSDEEIEEIHYLPTEANIGVASKYGDTAGNLIYYDLKMHCKTKTDSKSFILEMQRQRHEGTSNRWLFYAARAVSSQSLTSGYAKLLPVKLLVVCNFDPVDVAHKDDFIVDWNLAKSVNKDISKAVYVNSLISLTYVILPRFRGKLIEESGLASSSVTTTNEKDELLFAWLKLLSKGEDEIVALDHQTTLNDPNLIGAYKRISQLTPDEYEALQDDISKNMLAAQIAKEAEEAARAEGKAQGQAEGRKRGREELTDDIVGKLIDLSTPRAVLLEIFNNSEEV
jgi:hypothetical protein